MDKKQELTNNYVIDFTNNYVIDFSNNFSVFPTHVGMFKLSTIRIIDGESPHTRLCFLGEAEIMLSLLWRNDNEKNVNGVVFSYGVATGSNR